MTVLRVNKIAASGQTSENTGSVFFDGTGDYLNIPNNTQFEVGADFTFETWIYRTSLGSLNTIYSYLTPSTTLYGLSFILTTTGIGIYGYNNGDSSYNELLSINGVVPINEWHHVAVVRSNSTWYYYIDGVLRGSGTMTSFSYSGTPTFYIGYQNDNYANSFVGYLSNYRVVKGKALYTSNFTPPTTELEVTPETVLVACYDGENIFAEKTGKIIAAYGDRSSGIHTVGESPIGITTFQPGLTRSVDVTAGPVLQGNLEYNSQNFLVLPKGTTEDRNRTGGRGLFSLSSGSPSALNTINYIQISSSGNSFDFGDLSYAGSQGTAVSSSTRGIFNNGNNPGDANYSSTNVLDYVTIATTGNSVDFGDLTTFRHGSAPLSNSTRGVFVGGLNEYDSPYPTGSATRSYTNTIDYISMATLGNAIDFGDSISSASSHNSATCSSTRGVYTISYNGSANDNSLYYITISTTGNGQDFGNLSYDNGNRQHRGVVSNGTRGIFAGALVGPAASSNIDHITIATLGDGQDFGDLTLARRTLGGTSNSVRGVFAGGYDAPPGPAGRVNLIDHITIASTGDAKDFGDLIEKVHENVGCSDSHGGLS